MRIVTCNLKYVVTAFVFIFCLLRPAWAQDDRMDQLFERLQTATPETYEQVENEIWTEWSKSGSPAMDLLLKRGRDAIEAGEYEAAIEHLTALTDHAPDFAEGWNARATAYYHNGLYGPSVDDIQRALILNPRHFGAMAGLATIFEELGHDQEALEVYQAVLDLHPHRVNVQDAITRLQGPKI
jgi:tetratricopeptide (TPR) repeat protein